MLVEGWWRSVTAEDGKVGETSKSKIDFESIQLKKKEKKKKKEIPPPPLKLVLAAAATLDLLAQSCLSTVMKLVLGWLLENDC